MNDAQININNYLTNFDGNPDSLSVQTIRCFVGMIETGEATFDDFRSISDTLAAQVAKTKQNLDDIRDDN